MIDAPKTRVEAKKYVYGEWPGNSRGNKYNPERCAYELMQVGSWVPSQCRRKPGHGPAKLYCKQHARKVEGK